MAVAEPTVLPVAPIRASEELSLRTRRGRLLLGAITAAHFAHHTSNSLLNPLLPLIRDTFALSYAQSGFAVSAYSLSLGLSNGPIGLLADRVGSRTVIVIGLTLTGLVSVALAQAQVPNELLVLPLAIFGLACSMRGTATEVLVMDTAPADRRGAVLGAYYLAAQPIGGIATPVFGGIAGLTGIAAAFSGAGLLLVAMSAHRGHRGARDASGLTIRSLE
jgi:MFS family permease